MEQEARGTRTLARRTVGQAQTEVRLPSGLVGAQQLCVIAGPCAVESREQILEIASFVKEQGALGLRGGAFKPRTSPYSFQGSEQQGLEWLAMAREATGLAVITEVMDPAMVGMVAEYADVLQIGTRSMQNFPLLRAAARTQKPILLKRGMASTLEELLYSAEYILLEGNDQVLLCERGIRTFEQETRNTFDINAIPALKRMTHLPVMADPSHGTGKSEYVTAIARAAVAAGADGLLIEVHPRPEQALSDGRQSLDFQRFSEMMDQVRRIAQAVDRTL
ncbi:MAG: 3-deoxy-7-phosphoheptulonate synthase [Myxococcales bacterium]|nr:3-deoxy-7-phosphoheptulonate synthase [Myxococcales bacterium]